MNDRATLGSISPFFIVSELPRTLRFYEQLGFELLLQVPEEDPFFAIVTRDAVQIHLKAISTGPNPNPSTETETAQDAFVHVQAPDALARELEKRAVRFREPLTDRDDGIRGFSVADPDGYVIFFGRPIGP